MPTKATTKKIVRFGVVFFLIVSGKSSFAQSVAGKPNSVSDTTRQAPGATHAAAAGTVEGPVISPNDQLSRLRQTIPLRYTKAVQKKVYTLTARNKSFVRKMLTKQQLYSPVFEEALLQHGLPVELKYLPVVESALNPRAVSPARAAGLWQFMPSVGRSYDLQVDAYVDERMDPAKSTLAACRYLKVLYKMFGDWELALAAYNAGPGRVRRAIRRSGNRTSFAAISPYLPKETQAYVPAFVAVTCVMANHRTFNIYPDSTSQFTPFDTIQVDRPLDLRLLAKQLRIPLKELQGLNPSFKGTLIPAHVKNYTLHVPAQAMEMLATRRQLIFDAATPRLTPSLKRALLAASMSADKKRVSRKVKAGETLYGLANQYQVSIANIRKWNWMKNDVLKKGQTLMIWLDNPANLSAAEPASPLVMIARIELLQGKSLTFSEKTDVVLCRNYGIESGLVVKNSPGSEE